MAQLSDVLRKPLVKVITRLVLYGLAAILAKLGADAATSESASAAEAIADGVVSAGLLVAGAALDRWHHRKDLAQSPPVPE